MIPSYLKIEILAIRDEFITQGHKGLKGMRFFQTALFIRGSNLISGTQ